MAIARLDLTESQHFGFDKLEEEQAVLDAKKGRFLAACYRELGGDPFKDKFEWQPRDRAFYRITPDPDDNSGASQAGQ